MVIQFTGKIIYWRGPAPWYFVSVPTDQSYEIKLISAIATYGWGVIPAYITIGKTMFYTALFPKDGHYLVPLKKRVREAENLDINDEVSIQLEIRL